MTVLINWLNTQGETAQYYLFFALLFTLMGIEMIAPLRKGNQNRKGRWLANFGLTIINILFTGLLPISFITASIFSEEYQLGVLNQLQAVFAIEIVLSLLLRGFISFFTHYLAHKVPLFWRLHRIHHLDTELDISTTVRFHPMEFILNLGIGLPFIIIFGLSPWALMCYELFDIAVNLFSHSNISLPKGIERWLRYLIVTPGLHRVHHSAHQPETDSNFSAVFPIWDIAFGTFRVKEREAQKEMELGLEEIRDGRTNRLGWLLWSPVKRFRKDSR